MTTVGVKNMLVVEIVVTVAVAGYAVSQHKEENIDSPNNEQVSTRHYKTNDHCY